MGAGLNYYWETPGIRAALAAGKTSNRELVGAMALRPLDFEPGSHFQYSLCHDVRGALIEVWSGKNGYQLLKPETVKIVGTNQVQGQALADFGVLRSGYGYGMGVRIHMDPKESGSASPIGEFGWDGAAGAFGMVDLVNHISLTYFQKNHKWEVPMQLEMMKALYTKD